MKNNILKKTVLCLVVHIISWGLLTFCDWMEETRGEDLFGYVALITPLVLTVLYFCLRKKLYGASEISMRHVLQLCGIWLVISCAFGVLLTMLVVRWNRWIVHQAHEGWDNFLNGIEYPLFGFLLGVLPLIAVILGEVIIRIVQKYFVGRRKS